MLVDIKKEHTNNEPNVNGENQIANALKKKLDKNFCSYANERLDGRIEYLKNKEGQVIILKIILVMKLKYWLV